MDVELRSKVDLLSDNYNDIRKALRWDGNLLNHFEALLYVRTDKEFSLEKIKEVIIEAILEAMKNKKDNSYNNSGPRESGDLILRIKDTDLGRIAIEAINKVNRQAGEQLLNL